jgi:hypothetical protein
LWVLLNRLRAIGAGYDAAYGAVVVVIAAIPAR